MININELINEGNRLKEYKGNRSSNTYRERYTTWKTTCLLFINEAKADKVIRGNFLIAAANFERTFKDTSRIAEMVGILRAFLQKETGHSDNSKATNEPVTNCDQLPDKFEEQSISPDYIEQMILNIRGQQVMADRDLAVLYGVETKVLNQAVKRNLARFPERFRFQLTKEEKNNLVANCDRFTKLKHSTVQPYVFTEQGISMLSSVLNSQTAIETSIKIMDAFVSMRRFLIQNANILMRISNLKQHQMETDFKLDAVLNKIEETSPKLLPEQIFQTGCVWDAWTFVSDLIRNAKERIVLIDNFVDDRVLSLLSKRNPNVSATIYTRYNESYLTDLQKHNKQYPEIVSKQLHNKNHDRFLIIDDVAFLLGASVKDVGNSLCAITKLEATPEAILNLIK